MLFPQLILTSIFKFSYSKLLLQKNYGSMDPENIGKVKAIYEDLKLPKLFLQYEEQAYNDIIARIGQMSGGGSNRRLNPEVFYYFLNKIYKRNR